MDVKCENCGTEYDFDDAKVTAAGITVKCTHCGHLFRVARPAAPAPADVRDTQEDQPARHRHWMIRNRHGEIREFRDLTTLQQWIVERKVSREDEISKTGESWKSLGSIAELAPFFRAVDGASGRGTDEILNGGELLQRGSASNPPPQRPPPFGAEAVMPTGRFRLDGPIKPPTPAEGLRRVSGPPMPSTPLDTNPTVPITRPGRTTQPPQPVVKVHRTALPVEERRPLAPEPAALVAPLSRPFVGEAVPPREESNQRAFMTGVLATVALAGLAYFIYDQSRDDAPPPEAPQTASELYLTIERGEAEYERDTEASFARAEAAFADVLRLAGKSPRDPSLVVRAHLGRARVAMARAEYLKLEGKDHSMLLKAAEAALAEALALDDSNPAVQLGYADFYRIQGSRQRASRYLAKVEAAGVDSDEAQLVRAAVNVHNGDWSAVESRLSKLPPSALDRPRARYLLALALARSGRTQEATFALTQLLARHGEHEPARRLLERLGAGDVPIEAPLEAALDPEAPHSDAPASDAPASVAPASVASEPPVRVVIAPPSVAPPSVARVAPPTAARVAPASRPVAAGFDGLMDRARKAQERGRVGEARQLLLEALSSRPDNPEALASLGWCDMDESNFPRAISYFRRSLTAYGGYADARYGLGLALERSGQKDDALRVYQEYITRHPSGRQTAIVKQRIEQLGGG
jgi:predicted Zn finger-like uncharacterized protein